MDDDLRSLEHQLRSQTIYQLCRAIKKEENSLYNCIVSIMEDTVFVEEIRRSVSCPYGACPSPRSLRPPP